jgi:hypothetical protein
MAKASDVCWIEEVLIPMFWVFVKGGTISTSWADEERSRRERETDLSSDVDLLPVLRVIDLVLGVVVGWMSEGGWRIGFRGRNEEGEEARASRSMSETSGVNDADSSSEGMRNWR